MMALTEEQFHQLLQNQRNAGQQVDAMPLTKQLKPNKYGARLKEVDGIVFRSAFEASRYIELKALQQAGAITDLVLQPRFTLQYACDRFIDGTMKRLREIIYIADFQYMEIRPDHQRDVLVVEDTKGFETAVFRIKEKMFRERYPHIRLDIIKKGKR